MEYHRHPANLFWGLTFLLLNLAATAQENPPKLAGLDSSFASAIAYSITPDGQTVVGAAYNGAGFQAFHWTPDSLIILAGADWSWASAVSGDGRVVCGWAGPNQSDALPFRWTADSGMMDLGLPRGHCVDISADGNIIVGYYYLTGENRLFRWESGSVDLLPLPSDSTLAVLYGLSADGQVAVGAIVVDNFARAAVWNGTSQPTLLPGLSGALSSTAYDVSADGNIIVGYTSSLGFSPACRWVGGILETLPIPTGYDNSRALRVSEDGSVILHEARVNQTTTYFLWDENNGNRELFSALANEYNYIVSGWDYLTVYDMVAENGQLRYLTGFGRTQANGGGAWRIELPSFQIKSPLGGDRWTVDSRDTIRWQAPGTDFVNIELSGNNGHSWQTIGFTTTAGDSHLVYRIPDTLLTNNTYRIRVSDLFDTTHFVISDPFTIKGYDLSRLMPDSTIQIFEPARNGWPYSNSSNNMWPMSWWQRFNYRTGTDPATGFSYPGFWVQAPVSARSQDFPDWPLWVETFGESQCYWSTTARLYKIDAITSWRTRKATWGGSCYGFSASSLFAFQFPDIFLNYFPEIPQADSLYALFLTNSIRKIINRHFTHQFGKTFLAKYRQGINQSPRDLLREARQMFLDDNHLPRGLVYFHPTLPQGHSVVPTHLRRDPVNAGQWRLYVYNSNRPGNANQFIFIDSTANTWSDSISTNFGGSNKKCFLDLTVEHFLQTPVFYRPGSGPVGDTPQTGYFQVNVPVNADTRIANTLGESMGWVDSVLVDNLPGGLPLIPITSTLAPPYGYDLPENDYTLEISRLVDSVLAISVDFDSLIYSYDRSRVLPNESEEIRINRGLVISNPDLNGRAVRLETISRADTLERRAEASVLSLARGDSLAMRMGNDSQWELKNFGRTTLYRLSLTQVSQNGKAIFENAALALDANTTHLVAPDWADLENTPVTIYIDNGNDGTIDDSMRVNNEATGLGDGATGRRGDGEIPTRFALEQNYPNPFNPSTSIAFGLPETAGVNLIVYDLLGRKVATIAEGVRPAGWHTAQWDGRDDAGKPVASGIYLYRLQSGQFMQTRKMLLVR